MALDTKAILQTATACHRCAVAEMCGGRNVIGGVDRLSRLQITALLSASAVTGELAVNVVSLLGRLR